MVKLDPKFGSKGGGIGGCWGLREQCTMGGLSKFSTVEGDCGTSFLLLSMLTHDVNTGSDTCSHHDPMDCPVLT